VIRSLRQGGFRWQRCDMTENKNDKPKMAGGIFIALGMLIGAIIGVFIGQPSAGMVSGLAIGVVIALIIWWQDSKNRQES
jgi:uncharacterized protein YqgC (DUF456 family)